MSVIELFRAPLVKVAFINDSSETASRHLAQEVEVDARKPVDGLCINIRGSEVLNNWSGN
jgi:hypothetical protein